jgi:hypothetical protein
MRTSSEKFAYLFREHFLLRMLFFFGFLTSVWAIRFPFVFNKIYAEDGKVYLSDALKFRFPKDLIEPVAGYSTLIMRIGGRFVSLFPLELAGIMCGIFSALCLSFLAAGIFQYNNFGSQSFVSRFLLAIAFIFLPLASFSAVGNVANLYIYFMSASAVFLYCMDSNKKFTFYKSFVLLIAALSLPLSIFLLPLVLHRAYLERKKTGTWRIQVSDMYFFTGLLLQFIFIAVTSLGDRAPHAPQSLFKIIYLYVERGVGISIVPMWGFVSGTNSSPAYENTPPFLNYLSIRLVVLIFIITTLGLIYYRSRKKLNIDLRSQFWFILILGSSYSIIVGLFFNPEPRYMIFTSFLTYWAILLLVESQSSFILKACLHIYLIVVLILGLTASAHRSIGPEWLPELIKARQDCSNLIPEQTVKIPILPVTPQWEMVLSCEILNRLDNQGNKNVVH